MKGYKKGTRKIGYICQNCGKKFINFISRKSKYCSHKCSEQDRKPLSGLVKKKIGKAQEGYHNSPKTEFKKGHKFVKGGEKGWFKKGQKPFNYQGGERTLSQKIKDDVRHKKWRKLVFEKNNYTCQKCRIKSGCGKRVYLEPHHIESKVDNLESVYIVDNGITFCEECHRLFHKKYGFGENTRKQLNEFLKEL